MYKATKETKRWLNALGIAKVVFDDEGYHSEYLEQIEGFIRRKKMYSPRIKPELIQKLYKLAKVRKVPMTRLVNKIVEDYFKENGGKLKEEITIQEATVNKYSKPWSPERIK